MENLPKVIGDKDISFFSGEFSFSKYVVGSVVKQILFFFA